MDLQEQLKKWFPDHEPEPDISTENTVDEPVWEGQEAPLRCHFEKRQGKPHTRVSGFEGDATLGKMWATELKQRLHVGGTFKQGEWIFQGDHRPLVMDFFKQKGFRVVRVGG